jgi:hypothetical protein
MASAWGFPFDEAFSFANSHGDSMKKGGLLKVMV